MISVRGASPAGANNPREAADWVRGMFGRVAPRYDLLNHLLSFHIDKYWRAGAVRRVRPILERPGARAIDLCCGTGDLMLALQRTAGSLVYGSDFCHAMLTAAAEKSIRRRARTALFEADALQLPLANGSFDLVTVSFGFRNLADYAAGLAEMRRLLRPGGLLAILEFTRPPNRFVRGVYESYCRRILPAIGGWISGDRDAYTYLPDSVRKFPDAAQLAAAMRRAGFADVGFEYFTLGTVALHWGRAASQPK
jgi:demethylmenaquinone methyltransferase / 2-methoxy-6-polyprenyl-1,4-benzoquinol methylase